MAIPVAADVEQNCFHEWLQQSLAEQVFNF
jgi:hypothetical protein